MCGFAGIASRSGAGDEALVVRMRETLRHRGPDDEGLWTSGDRYVTFGHRRLSIIDLSQNAHQPMVSAGASACIVYNGEIYNFSELRSELIEHGCVFVSNSDTEVILHAYRVWGVECVERLNGMFAFAIYDTARKRLFLARDRAGEKPLYFQHSDGALIFASEIKALLECPTVPRRFTVDALNSYLAFGYVSGDRTMFETVRRLPQGHVMLYDVGSDRLSIQQYWRLPDEPAPEGAPSDESLCEELHTLLGDAVKRQLVADVPVGILLSGGVDSSLVTAMASHAGSKVKTFTITFPGGGAHDEAPFARLVARYFGTEHHELAASPATADLLPELAEQFDDPVADSSMVPTYLVSRLVRREAKVALGGDGGDELFGGYLHYPLLLARDARQRFMPRAVRRAVHLGARRLLSSRIRGRRRLMRLTSDLPRAVANINTIFDVDERRRILQPAWHSLREDGSQPEAWLESLCAPAGSPLQQMTRADFKTYLCDDILAKVDRMSMLVSLEVRAPFLDHRIIRFAFGSVPDRLRAAGADRKVLLRMLGSRLLPRGLDLRRKQGFTIPFDRWFDGRWGAFIEDVLSGADSTIFDRAAIAAAIRGQRAGSRHTNQLFALTMFELWRRRYNVSIGTAR